MEIPRAWKFQWISMLHFPRLEQPIFPGKQGWVHSMQITSWNNANVVTIEAFLALTLKALKSILLFAIINIRKVLSWNYRLFSAKYLFMVKHKMFFPLSLPLPLQLKLLSALKFIELSQCLWLMHDFCTKLSCSELFSLPLKSKAFLEIV